MFYFVKRDFQIQVSYKMSFIFSWWGMVVNILTFFFLSKLFGNRINPYLEDYGGSYFPFVLIGLAFSQYISTALSSFSSSIRQEQMLGTLEYILVSKARLSTVILGSSIWRFTFSSINIIVYFLVGILLAGNFFNANWILVFFILFLTILIFSSIGIMSAGFIIVFKQGNPIQWLMGIFSGLFGGVYYPITVLPEKLQWISHLLPITYSLRAARYALLQNYSFYQVFYDIIILSGFAILLFPTSLLFFKFAVREAKKTGSLGHY
ncbi:MAG: ABC transporter permease [Candidatus Kaelpia imicola]|nr:ABC transporter permease [Candidatus Kaelpia imicola]